MRVWRWVDLISVGAGLARGRGAEHLNYINGPKGEAGMTTNAVSDRDAGEANHEHTNRLIHATSPYLLQHSHNPVDWYEWGPEALERARREDKPIFLSIGYSACHWCHVMERESFENNDTAKVMNEHYVCIKVDREERPDLDDIYMTATQAMTGSGGWPMSVWLTPDLQPFYAGTYFPPDSRYGRPGFKEVLLFLADVWAQEREKITRQANALTDVVQQLTTVEPGSRIVSHEVVTRTAGEIARAFDPIKGGISGGGTNKFPPSMAMNLMLRAYHQSLTPRKGETTGDTRLLELVELTLEKMAHGGIYDQLGGGIARYSTDEDWLVPHFEKMLYDQALVSDIYLKAYQLTRHPLYARVAGEILDYVINDLEGPEGGFYSSRDADSEGVEGKFYVWTKAEVTGIVGERDAALFCDYYDVTDAGNWEGRNILNVPRSAETVAGLHKLAEKELESRLRSARKRLFDAREKRVKPHLDDKMLASWNGLMIASMAKGYRILGETRYRDSAERAAECVLTRMTRDGRLLRSYRGGKAGTPGYLDDYAFMIDGLLSLFETTFDSKWLDQAVRLNDQVLIHFKDQRDGGFFFAANDAEKLLVRAKDATDSAIPSGNSVELMNLLRLSVLLDRRDYAGEAEEAFRAFGKQLAQAPIRCEQMLGALDFYYRRPREVAIIGTPEDLTGTDALINAAWCAYVPNVVFAAVPGDSSHMPELLGKIPLLVGKTPLQGRSAAYVCRNFACQAPTTDPEELRRQILR